MQRASGLAFLLAVLPVSALLAQTPEADNTFSQTNLVANSSAYNPLIINPDMLDAWGIALRPPGAGGHIWVNDAVGGTSLEYIGDVGGMPLHQDGLTSVTLHQPHFTDHGYAFATGIVYNAAKDLANQPVEFAVPDYNASDPGEVIQPGQTTQTGQPAQDNDNSPPTALPNTTGAAAFVFVTQDGCINCWRSNTATVVTDVPIVVDYSKTSNYFPYHANSVFTGVAMTTNAYTTPAYAHNGASVSGNLLFATDQRNNVIEVFENKKEPTDTTTNTWTDVTTSFHFQALANAGGLYVFNIQDIANHLYVTYAEFNPSGDEGQEQVEGAGLGHVAEFNEDGTLVREFNDGANTPAGVLDEPWGVAIAPPGYGKFGGDLLVANFGTGTVAAFDPNTGNFVDYLRDASGNPISIDGIWGLTFGNGVSLGDANTLYFTAGPNSEFDGLFGKLTFNTPPTDTPAMPTLFLVALGGLLLVVCARRLPRLGAPAGRT
jgi:uncharacterized protein (TIGR03118 family)